jgi:hypothetical protein
MTIRLWSNRYERSLFAIFVVTILVLSSVPLLAQLPTGTILGVVRDNSGAVIPGVTVTVRNTATDAARTVSTAEDGVYRVPALLVGTYDITAELTGFSTSVTRGVRLEVAQEAVVNFTLQVGAAAQAVEVVANAAQVETTTSSLGSVVNESKVSELPLNGRNFIDLTLLQTGVAWQPESSGNPPAGTGGTKFSSNGAPISSNNYMLDGAQISNIFGQSPTSIVGTTLGLAGIREFKVITNTFSGEYGLTMGSQVVLVSKGGANQFHGEMFEYLRNSAMDARNYFDPAPSAIGGKRLPPFKRNNFGGAFGGPIKTDKTFFWGTYEGQQRFGSRLPWFARRRHYQHGLSTTRGNFFSRAWLAFSRSCTVGKCLPASYRLQQSAESYPQICVYRPRHRELSSDTRRPQRFRQGHLFRPLHIRRRIAYRTPPV